MSENTTGLPPQNNQVKNNNNSEKVKITDMQIRIVVYGFIFIVFLFMVLYRPAMNKFNIGQAEGCFAAKNYVCAFKAYKSAFASGYDNEQFIPHYVETLARMKKVAVVQEELNKLLEDYPNNSSTPEIEAIFAEIKNSLVQEIEDTYIEYVILGTNVVHWNNYAGKIKVFVDTLYSNKIPAYYYEEVQKAFDDYTRGTENALQFVQVKAKDDADIKVIFVPEISGGQCNAGKNCVNILGLTETDINGSMLKQVELQLRMTDVDGTKFTANQIHNIAKHEIGHALGIAGHSYFSEDIMYPINNDAEWAEDTPTLLIRRKNFSTRDLNTLRLLYKIVPDVTNKKYNTATHSDMYFPIAVLGTKKEIGEKKLKESAQYMSTVSANFISQMNLAEGYFVNRDFASAEKAFADAIQLAKTDEEKFTAYHNLAVVKYEQSDYKNALSYADIANTYSPEKKSNEIKAYCYLETGKHSRAQQILERLIDENPDNINYSAALVGSYLKQYKFLQMFAEMKRIKEIAPDAFADPVYSQYKFFTGLV